MTAPASVNKWAPGASYGPVLTQTDLYLLKPELEIHPILQQKYANFHLLLNISTGQSQDETGNDFREKEEPAVLPRVDQLYIISEFSPWCTTVKNEKGVTLTDVCSAVWQEYASNYVTDAEMASLSTRGQEQVKRAAHAHQAPAYSYGPVAGTVRCRRVDWLKDRIFLEGIKRDDRYVQTRLGFQAPNIFVMSLTNY